MAVNKRKVLDIFKRDFKASEDYHDVWAGKRSKWIKEENGEAYGNEEKGKSQIVSRDIKKVNLQQHSAIIDPFVSTPNLIDAFPVTEEDRPTSEQAETLLNYQFCRDFPRYAFISEAYKVQQREGIVIVKVSWESEEGQITKTIPIIENQLVPGPQGLVQTQVQTGTKQIKTKGLLFNRPTAEVCDNSMIYIDPTCIGNISNAQFAVHKYMSNLSKLKSTGLYENLDKILEQSSSPYDGSDDDYDKRDANAFSFQDKPRQEIEVFEYWGNYDLNDDGIAEAIVCVWVNDTVIRLEENPYPDKQIPFISCAYDSEPFSINGKATADLIGVDQKIKTSIKRAMNNTLDSGTQGQKGLPKGMLDPINQKRFREGKDFEFNTGESANIWQGNFADIPNSTMAYYESISREIESLSGVSVIGSSKGGSSLGSSATAAAGILNSTEKREVDISRNLKENLFVPLFRKWHSMNIEFLEDEQIIRITNDEFVTIRRDDLHGNIDIDITVSTPAADAEKANDLSFMLQTMGQTLPFEMTQMILSEVAKLKRMPDLATKIKEYAPKPDPIAEEMKMLELEKLKSEIAERNSRAVENQSDIALKDAKTQSELAKTRKTHSDANNTDLDFVERESGNKRREDVQDKAMDHASKKDIENSKSKNQGSL